MLKRALAWILGDLDVRRVATVALAVALLLLSLLPQLASVATRLQEAAVLLVAWAAKHLADRKPTDAQIVATLAKRADETAAP